MLLHIFFMFSPVCKRDAFILLQANFCFLFIPNLDSWPAVGVCPHGILLFVRQFFLAKCFIFFGKSYTWIKSSTCLHAIVFFFQLCVCYRAGVTCFASTLFWFESSCPSFHYQFWHWFVIKSYVVVWTHAFSSSFVCVWLFGQFFLVCSSFLSFVKTVYITFFWLCRVLSLRRVVSVLSFPYFRFVLSGAFSPRRFFVCWLFDLLLNWLFCACLQITLPPSFSACLLHFN